MVTYETVRNDADIRALITRADESLIALGYTEHSFAHVTYVAETAGRILTALGYDGHYVDLVKIAGFLHDIGNLVNRKEHSQSGAVMAFTLLSKMGMPYDDIAVITTAIGNHDEGTGEPVSPLAAALILADKCDVRRSRVRNPDFSASDIHDRVNYSVEESALSISPETKEITLTLKIDTKYGPVMDYFEIFLSRMLLCRHAAIALGTTFRLTVNNQILL